MYYWAFRFRFYSRIYGVVSSGPVTSFCSQLSSYLQTCPPTPLVRSHLTFFLFIIEILFPFPLEVTSFQKSFPSFWSFIISSEKPIRIIATCIVKLSKEIMWPTYGGFPYWTKTFTKWKIQLIVVEILEHIEHFERLSTWFSNY